jgi:hypothetical protein
MRFNVHANPLSVIEVERSRVGACRAASFSRRRREKEDGAGQRAVRSCEAHSQIGWATNAYASRLPKLFDPMMHDSQWGRFFVLFLFRFPAPEILFQRVTRQMASTQTKRDRQREHGRSKHDRKRRRHRLVGQPDLF